MPLKSIFIYLSILTLLIISFYQLYIIHNYTREISKIKIKMEELRKQDIHCVKTDTIPKKLDDTTVKNYDSFTSTQIIHDTLQPVIYSNDVFVKFLKWDTNQVYYDTFIISKISQIDSVYNDKKYLAKNNSLKYSTMGFNVDILDTIYLKDNDINSLNNIIRANRRRRK